MRKGIYQPRRFLHNEEGRSRLIEQRAAHHLMYFPRLIRLGILAFLLGVGSLLPWFVPTALAVDPCCEIIGIDREKGIVMIRERAIGKTYQVVVKEIRQLMSLRVGQKVDRNLRSPGP